MFSRENPSTGQALAGLIRGSHTINQKEQCILRGGGYSHLKMVKVLRPLLAEWAWVIVLVKTRVMYRLLNLILQLLPVELIDWSVLSRDGQVRESQGGW